MERVADRSVPHVAALDGIRALAVVAVVLYHLRVSWAPGGFGGVPVFFVLSGYLITSLLAARWATHGGLGVRTFWRRRVRRLLPAQVALVAGIVALSPFVDSGAMRRLPVAAGTALAQVANWWQILGDEPYFEAAEGPTVFAHLWSLAVEAQLYLVWPLVLALLIRRRRPVAWVLVMAWASYVLMALLHEPYGDPTRAWVGTDVQAGPFLLGAAVALIAPPGVARGAPGRHAGLLLDVAGTAAIGALAWFIASVTDFEPTAYRGGLAIVGAASATLLVVAAHPSSLLARLLALSPLRWVGERSYGLYLWHWPVIALTRHWDWPPLRLAAAQVVVSVLAAAGSYRFVEVRFRQHHARRRTPVAAGWRPPLLPRAAVVAATACVLAAAVMAWEGRADRPEVVLASNRVVRALPTTTTTTLPPTTTTTAVLAPVEPTTTTTTSTTVPSGIDIAIGDSVLADASPPLHDAVPGITVDARVGRQLVDAIDTVRQWRARVGFHRVVLALGTNGPFAPERLDELLGHLTDVRRVVLVNVRMPRSWEAEVNATLAAATARWPNVVLVDWHGFSRHRTDLFAHDGIHMNRDGARAYAMLVAAGLAIAG